MRSLYALALTLALILPGCDSSEPVPDLFLIPEITQRQTFSIPQDSLVTLPVQIFEYVYTFSGPQVVGATLNLSSAANLDIGAYVVAQGYTADAVRSITFTDTPDLRLISGATTLGAFDNASASFVVGGVAVPFASTAGSFAFNTATVELGLQSETVPIGYAASPLPGRLSLRTDTAIPAGTTYEVRVSFPLRIRVNARAVGTSIEVTADDQDVRAVLLANQFDIGDVERARYVSLKVTPTDTPAFIDRVARVVVRAATTSGEGTPVLLGTVTEFNEPLVIDADVADIIRRTGRVRITATVELDPGPAPAPSSLGFQLETKLRVEVPQPTTGGGA
jgi:hypothetical protein